MIVSEAVTNAVKHGFPGRGGGTVRLAVRETDDRTIAISVADDGAGLPPGATWPDQASLGGRLILQLARSMNAEIKLDTGPAGTTIAVLVPSAARDRF